MRIAAILSVLALAFTATVANAKPAKVKHKSKDAAAADQAGEQGEEPVGDHQHEQAGVRPDLPEAPGLVWQRGPTKADLGNAAIDVPAGFAFTGAEGTRVLMQMMHNDVSNNEHGTLWKIDPKDSWFVVFVYSDSGHVKDDDKDELDAGKVLKNLQENTEAANEERKERGWEALHITGWAVEPHYDDQTHNLEWATKLVGDGDPNDQSINYNVRLLGREGVMSAILAADPSQLTGATPVFKQLLGTFAYSEGSRYGDYKQGDKLAEYGIAGLILGGGLAVAAKAGLLTKLGAMLLKFIKPVILGVGALFAGVAKMFKRGPKTAAVPDATKKA